MRYQREVHKEVQREVRMESKRFYAHGKLLITGEYFVLGWLDASGIIIHINPLQEWFQPGGDSFCYPPLVTLNNFLEFL
ncbi:MAG: hypothetical protein HQK53_20265, partial [Oligoflexia bacterium]|nr:hypothetical protein [Oligoflexia bacterium]